MNSIWSNNIFINFLGKLIKAGCVALLSILMCCCAKQTTKTDPAETAVVITSAPLIAPPLTATLDPKVALRESIDQALGVDNENLSRLTKIAYSRPETGDITITWATNENVSQNSKKAAAQIDATNILKALNNNKTRFIYVILVGTSLTQDKYGNAAETQALSLGFNRSKLDKINWEDFQPSDIYNLADVVEAADEWK